jgi:hypothetical protein
MVYDIIFMVQHYGLCQHNNDKIHLKSRKPTAGYGGRRPRGVRRCSVTPAVPLTLVGSWTHRCVVSRASQHDNAIPAKPRTVRHASPPQFVELLAQEATSQLTLKQASRRLAEAAATNAAMHTKTQDGRAARRATTVVLGADHLQKHTKGARHAAAVAPIGLATTHPVCSLSVRVPDGVMRDAIESRRPHSPYMRAETQLPVCSTVAMGRMSVVVFRRRES